MLSRFQNLHIHICAGSDPLSPPPLTAPLTAYPPHRRPLEPIGQDWIQGRNGSVPGAVTLEDTRPTPTPPAPAVARRLGKMRLGPKDDALAVAVSRAPATRRRPPIAPAAAPPPTRPAGRDVGVKPLMSGQDRGGVTARAEPGAGRSDWDEREASWGCSCGPS